VATITATAVLGMAAVAEAVIGRRHSATAVTRHVDAGGYRLPVTERGTRPIPQTPAVLIVVGADDCQASWAAVVDHLAERTLVITFDRVSTPEQRVFEVQMTPGQRAAWVESVRRG
jgi:hypothetical protein